MLLNSINCERKITMLTLKEINKIRTMYYEQNYRATEIARIMKISRQSVYKYIKFVDFLMKFKRKKLM